MTHIQTITYKNIIQEENPIFLYFNYNNPWILYFTSNLKYKTEHMISSHRNHIHFINIKKTQNNTIS